MIEMDKEKERNDDWDRDFFDDMFGDFEDDFKRMNERLMRFFNGIRKNPDQNIEGPFVYGFTFRQSAGGKPYFQEFGNVPEMMHNRVRDQLEQDVREPLTDINEDANNVYVTYELPGISRENIDLKVDDEMVTLNVKEG
ncbi:heat shock protein (hsp20) related protein, partial [mine drainage metagenome]